MVKLVVSGDPVPETRVCTRCSQRLPVDEFYFVSKKLGTRRGQCKSCLKEIKAAQRDPTWTPTCAKCGNERERLGSGRRLCEPCFDEIYDIEDPRPNGSARLKLSPCSACGVKRLRVDTTPGTMLCAVCRSVPAHRRTRLVGLFNLTPREFVELLDSQNGLCAICGKPRRKNLAVDHKHGKPPSNVIRGVVCVRCNLLLGVALDSPATLRMAADYLDDPPAQRLFPGRCALPGADRNTPGIAAKYFIPKAA